MNRPDAPHNVKPESDARELLSRLADGDCDGQVTPAACARWAADHEARETWHCYQLIGDVLRSEDLSRSPTMDASFLATLRVRLAAESPILAPSALPQEAAPSWQSRRWVVPAALAAGIAAVVGVAAVMRAQQVEAPADGGQLAGTSTVATESLQAAVLRDARLDRYLHAHHGMRAGATVALPGSGLRNVDMLVPAR